MVTLQPSKQNDTPSQNDAPSNKDHDSSESIKKFLDANGEECHQSDFSGKNAHHQVESSVDICVSEPKTNGEIELPSEFRILLPSYD